MTYTEWAETADFYIEKDLRMAPLLAMHHHRTYELYYMVKGNREYFIDDRFFRIEEGDLVLIPRKVLHRTAGSGGLRILVHFSENFLKKYFTAASMEPLLQSLPFVFRPNERERDRIVAVLNILLEEFHKADQGSDPRHDAMLAGHLYHILCTMAYGNNAYVPYDYTDERITKIIQYINENYNRIGDIEEIAAHFFISKHHLCRFFKKKLGISVVSYLNTIKVREACAMIKGGCANLTQVALQCGFNSASYFSKVFKKEKGISPTQYKKKHK